MTQIYFEHVLTKKRFKVVEAKERDGKTYMVLECPNGTFEELYTKERFKQMNYRLIKVEDGEEDE